MEVYDFEGIERSQRHDRDQLKARPEQIQF